MEKVLWLRLHGLKEIPVIVVPYSQSKLEYVDTEDAILLDDFSRNCHEWKNAGKTAIKYRNAVNGSHGTWTGPSISEDMTVREMEKIVLQAM